MKYVIPIAMLLLMACNTKKYDTSMKIPYPLTPKVDVVDTYFGTEIADPYRWLEDDRSEQTMEWVDAQNAVTNAYLKNIPFRNKIKSRLKELWDYPKSSAPFKKNGLYFQYKNDGLQNQDALYLKSSAEDEGTILLDPNTLSDDGTVALSTVSVSKNGKYLAYAISRGGSDWNEIYVRDIDTGEDLNDHIQWVKHSGLSWFGNGFFYSRFPEPVEGDELKGANENSKVYFHQVGTSQAKDKLIYEDTEHPNRSFSPEVVGERYLSLYVYESTSGNALYLKDLKERAANWIRLVDNFEKDYTIIDVSEGKLLISTNHNAPRYKVMLADLSSPQQANWKTLVPEKQHTLVDANSVGGKLLLEYLKDARSMVEIYTLQGKEKGELKLPGIGSVSGFVGEKQDRETYYTFTSFTTPGTIYKYDVEKNTSTLFSKSEIAFDTENYETKQVFYASKDGTKIPMFITYKKGLGLDGERPTLLYAYGGFNISLTPTFSITRLIWLEKGGVLAIPNIRGGGEYGEEWHKAGTLMQKQNVFDDFIAAAQYLIDNHYTSTQRLTIQGGSNGGLLIGAVTNQQPGMFAVALPAVGVMDMLRYHKFTIGRYWATDYGTSEDSKEMFSYLLGYSPVHTVKDRTEYPAVLVTTADHDDRVVPAHSFKYAAELQAKKIGYTPRLIRIDKDAGHGAGKPTDKIIAYYADLWAFSFFNMQFDPAY